jgi:hypothetical protein
VEFFPVFSTDQIVPVWADFDHLAWDGPAGGVWVLDEDMIIDFEGCESVGSSVVECSALLTAGGHAAFKLLWLPLPFVGERAVV